MADGLRAVHLKPGTSRGFICYIQALKACGDAERVKVAIDKFNKRFPKEKEHLKKSIEQCMCVHMYVCAYVCMCICVCMYVCAYVCMYVCSVLQYMY